MARARMLVGAVALATFGTALVGCTPDSGAPQPTPSESPSSTSASPADAAPLEIAVHGNELRIETYQQIVDAFLEEHPDVEAEVTSYPDSAASVEDILTSLEAGWKPDVFLADYRHLADLVATGELEPVDTLLGERGIEFGDDFQRAALTAFSADNRLQCMPAEVSPLVVYYNKRLLRRAQPPELPVELPDAEDTTWSWAEFVTMARATAGLDRLGPIKGAHIPADVETLTAFVRSAGGDVVDDLFDPSTLTLASDEALTAIDELAVLARDSAITPTAGELAEQDAVERFTAGELGMFIGTRDALPRLRAADRLRFDVLPLPSLGRSRSVAKMNGWCINSATEQLDAAGDFVAFAVSQEGGEIAARSGAIVPSSLDLVYDEVFTQPRRQPQNSHVWPTSIGRSDPMPYAQRWDSVSAQVESVLARLYNRPNINLEATLENRMVRLVERSEELLGDEE